MPEGDLPGWRTGHKRDARGAPAGSNGGSKGGGGQGGSKASRRAQANGELEQAVVSLQKLALRETAGNREMANFMNEFWLLPYASRVSKGGLKAGQEYQEKVKNIGKGHNLGPPHAHVAMQVVEEMSEVLPETEEGEEHKRVLTELLVLGNKPWGLAVIDEVFKTFRVKECYKDDKMDETDRRVKLSYSLNPCPCIRTAAESMKTGEELGPIPPVQVLKIKEAMGVALLGIGGVRPIGPGPRTELERVIERQMRGLLTAAS